MKKMRNQKGAANACAEMLMTLKILIMMTQGAKYFSQASKH